MATESLPPLAPTLALVIDATEKLRAADKWRTFQRDAADEIIEDVIHILGLLEAYAYLDDERPLIDPHAISSAASMLVEKLRKAQRYLRGEA